MTDSPSQVSVCVIASAGETHRRDAPTGVRMDAEKSRNIPLRSPRLSCAKTDGTTSLTGSLHAARDKQDKQSPALRKLTIQLEAEEVGNPEALFAAILGAVLEVVT